uniref:Uncharacterized protein n=1 Tax=Globisporangium ultimum (strain ATCC 200006 / CBS 805.95 / DAOM BR144) TaxID=431595 RepID=K3WM69_GLOUD
MLLEGMRAPKELEAVSVDWNRVFRCHKRIVRLDLSVIPVDSRHLGRALEAASTHCSDLRTLILP